MLHHEESPEKSQFPTKSPPPPLPPISRQPPPILLYPLFSDKKFWEERKEKLN